MSVRPRCRSSDCIGNLPSSSCHVLNDRHSRSMHGWVRAPLGWLWTPACKRHVSRVRVSPVLGRPLCDVQIDGVIVSIGSRHVRPPAGFVAADQSFESGRQEADLRHRVQSTLSCPSDFSKAARQPSLGSTRCASTKPPLAASGSRPVAAVRQRHFREGLLREAEKGDQTTMAYGAAAPARIGSGYIGFFTGPECAGPE